MLKRLTIVLVLTLALVIGFAPRRQTVLSNVLSAAELAVVNEAAADVPATGDAQTKQNGNGFVKVITAPFRAIGRLFGRGGDNKKNAIKVEKLSEKDLKKFEASKITRVVDARTAPVAAPSVDVPPAADGASLESDATAAELNKKLALEHLARGRQLFSQNDISGAINSLSMAVSLDKELWEAHNLLGIAYEMKGLRSKALESLETALKAKEDQPEHLNDFGYLLFKNGEYSRAVKYLKRAVKAQPDNQRFLNNLGMAQVEVGKFDEAFKNFEKAMGEFDGRMNMATRLLRLGYDKEAIKHLERCRALQPKSPDILYRLSVLYARNGQIEEAAEANKAFLSLRATATTAGQQ